MKKALKNNLTLLAITLLPTFLIWIPFYFKFESLWTIPLKSEGMATIVANFDGPLYLVIAKTFYNTDIIRHTYSFPIPLEYYAAHFPLYPLLIRLFSSLAGFPYSMLFTTIMSSFVAIYFFQKLIKDYVDKKDILWITLVFSLFPARWLISRSVGSADPLFIAAVIASLYYFKNKKYWYSAIWGVVAQLTKSPGILLLIAYFLYIVTPNIKKFATTSFNMWVKSLNLKKRLPVLLIPIALLSVFYIYKLTFNNFFAYFNSGDNLHLFFPPFQVFNYNAPWVGTFWLEEIIFVYLFGILGILRLINKKEYLFAWFVGIFFLSTLFVAHRDLIRYSLPIIPFLYVAFSDLITKKEFRIAFFILIVPIYLFSITFISQNVMPISDWAPFL